MSKRQVRISVGEGLIKSVNNDIAKKILDECIIPNFKEKKYYQGILLFIEKIKECVTEKGGGYDEVQVENGYEPMGPIGYDEEGVVIYPEGIPEEIALLEGERVVPVEGKVTSKFDPERMHPTLHIKRPHTGVDYGVPEGTKVRVAYDGKVIEARDAGDARGYYIIVDHGNDFTTRYYHLKADSLKVDINQPIKAGTVIAESGNTGIGTGPHLHFETRYKNQAFNPELFFSTWDLRTKPLKSMVISSY